MSQSNREISNAEPLEASTRFRHLTKDDLHLVRFYEPNFMVEVDKAILAKRPVYLQLFGYESNRDIIAACLWYALDHGVKVIVTMSVIEAEAVNSGAVEVSDTGADASEANAAEADAPGAGSGVDGF